MSEEQIEQEINKLSNIEHNTQQLLSQRNQILQELNEIESAMNETKETTETFKLYGNIMIKQNTEKILEELKKTKDKYEIKLNIVREQEKKLREQAKELQKKIVTQLEKEKGER